MTVRVKMHEECVFRKKNSSENLSRRSLLRVNPMCSVTSEPSPLISISPRMRRGVSGCSDSFWEKLEGTKGGRTHSVCVVMFAYSTLFSVHSTTVMRMEKVTKL